MINRLEAGQFIIQSAKIRLLLCVLATIFRAHNDGAVATDIISAMVKSLVRIIAILVVGGCLLAQKGAFDLAVSASKGDKAALLELEHLAYIGKAEAQFWFASIHQYPGGGVVPMDKALAMAWYRKASEQGHAESEFQIGVMYAFGEGVPKDMAQASSWYRKSADRGYPTAQWNLGVLYDKGNGVPKDASQAVSWYRKAAEQDYCDGQFSLGTMYHKGVGVSQNDVIAYMWWNLAAAHCNELGKAGRDALEKVMTPAQIAEAQKLSTEWKPKASK